MALDTLQKSKQNKWNLPKMRSLYIVHSIEMDRINYGNGFDEELIALIRHAALLPLWLYTHTHFGVLWPSSVVASSTPLALRWIYAGKLYIVWCVQVGCVLPMTMTMVILTVLILARGMMPRELARLQSRSRPLCLSGEWKKINTYMHKLIIDSWDCKRNLPSLTRRHQHRALRPDRPDDDRIARRDDNRRQNEQRRGHQRHVHLPAPRSAQIDPALSPI